MEENEKPGESAEKKDKGGFFTGKLPWWQVLLAVVLVAYLFYGKYQEEKAKAQGAPVAPATSK